MGNEDLKKTRKKLVFQSDGYSEMECIRENLRLYLLSKEITINGLSESAGISVDTLKTLLYGKAKDYRGATISGLAKALHVTKDELTGSMDKRTAKSLAAYEDDLPNRSKRLIDWHINHQIHELTAHPKEKRIPIMTPIIDNNGSLKQSHNYDYMDISFVEGNLSPKIYFGLKIPCDFYEPFFFEGDVLLLANERKPIANELSVIVVNGVLAMVRRKREKGAVKYYSIRDNSFRADDIPRIEFVGYVVKVLESKA